MQDDNRPPAPVKSRDSRQRTQRRASVPYGVLSDTLAADPTLPPSAKLILLKLPSMAFKDGRQRRTFSPYLAEIALATGLSVPTVRRSLNRMAERGLIEVVDASRHATRRTVTLAWLSDPKLHPYPVKTRPESRDQNDQARDQNDRTPDQIDREYSNSEVPNSPSETTGVPPPSSCRRNVFANEDDEAAGRLVEDASIRRIGRKLDEIASGKVTGAKLTTAARCVALWLGKMLGDDHSFGCYFAIAKGVSTGEHQAEDVRAVVARAVEKMAGMHGEPAENPGAYFVAAIQFREAGRAFDELEAEFGKTYG